mgnify:CR=1 FL=1
MRVAINGTACWTALLLWLRWRGKKCMNILMKINISYEFQLFFKDIVLLINAYNLLCKDFVVHNLLWKVSYL